MYEYSFINHTDYIEYPEGEMKERSAEFLKMMRRRRSVRDFSDRDVPREIIDNCIMAAGTAPNGANMQPWHFVVIQEPSVKKKIREGAEKEEFDFYNNRAPDDWLEALRPLGTDEKKPFLEKAPCLIAIFSKSYGVDQKGEKEKHYYVRESVGIATGILITALHHAGLVSLTHTPSPMGFLNDILDRPKNEKPFLLLVTGYPETGAKVPDISKKGLDEIATFF